MDNRDTRAAWRYHDGTKHPDGFLMNRWHTFDPSRQPLLFKQYLGLDVVPLPLDTSSLAVPALAAISTNVEPADEERIPDSGALARLLYFSAGITKTLRYPWGAMPFRAAACTGALYHIELYVVCGDLPGLAAGVYHFDPQEVSLKRLRAGDYRAILVDASGSEPRVAHAPAVIVYTDVFWRNAVKYQAREYRHAFWDSGTILAHTLAVAAAHQLPAKVVMGFVDETVNRLLDLDAEREVALALLPIGYVQDTPGGPAREVTPLNAQATPISDHEIAFPPILAMHQASSLADAGEAAAWRGAAPSTETPGPSGRLFPLHPLTGDDLPPDAIEPVILRRGSARQFAREPITFEQLSTALHYSTRGIPADCLDPPGVSLNTLYLIVNAVDDLPSGAYVFHRKQEVLELLTPGDFREAAGLLGLQQALAADASVNLYFLADLRPILERFGNRGYRAAQLDASIMAGRMYLAAYALGIGATGLTFFDDAVTKFFSPHAQGKSAMFLIALGRRAPRR